MHKIHCIRSNNNRKKRNKLRLVARTTSLQSVCILDQNDGIPCWLKYSSIGMIDSIEEPTSYAFEVTVNHKTNYCTYIALGIHVPWLCSKTLLSWFLAFLSCTGIQAGWNFRNVPNNTSQLLLIHILRRTVDWFWFIDWFVRKNDWHNNSCWK